MSWPHYILDRIVRELIEDRIIHIIIFKQQTVINQFNQENMSTVQEYRHREIHFLMVDNGKER